MRGGRQPDCDSGSGVTHSLCLVFQDKNNHTSDCEKAQDSFVMRNEPLKNMKLDFKGTVHPKIGFFLWLVVLFIHIDGFGVLSFGVIDSRDVCLLSG